jgi:lipoprotein-anchoring transpeptidase ErfK/SrfK
MTVRSLRSLFAAATLIVFLPGCALFKPKPPPPPPGPPPPKPPFAWNAQKALHERGPASVVIDLSEQRVYFYKGEMLIGETKCSSGKNGFDTPPGNYKVIQKNKYHVSNLYGNFVDLEGTIIQRDVDTSKMKVPEGATFVGAKMPYFQRFVGGYGLHAGLVPNRRASHGCVRLPRIMAERLFVHTTIGTPVIVRE